MMPNFVWTTHPPRDTSFEGTSFTPSFPVISVARIPFRNAKSSGLINTVISDVSPTLLSAVLIDAESFRH
jgi:hypothetical protein